MQFDTVELAIEALRKGESIIVVDDEDREMKVTLSQLLNGWLTIRLILWQKKDVVSYVHL